MKTRIKHYTMINIIRTNRAGCIDYTPVYFEQDPTHATVQAKTAEYNRRGFRVVQHGLDYNGQQRYAVIENGECKTGVAYEYEPAIGANEVM